VFFHARLQRPLVQAGAKNFSPLYVSIQRRSGRLEKDRHLDYSEAISWFYPGQLCAGDCFVEDSSQ
ncbi:MAG: hypothetical protein ACOC3Y_03275, partial [Desulfohalobiaceae bacterium]